MTVDAAAPTTSLAGAFIVTGGTGIVLGGGILLAQNTAAIPSPGWVTFGYVVLALAWAFLNAGLIGIAVRGQPVASPAGTSDLEALDPTTARLRQLSSQAHDMTGEEYLAARDRILRGED